MKRNTYEHNQLKEQVFIRDNFTCLKCGKILKKGMFKAYGEMRTNLIADHIIPLAMDGTNTLDNMQTLCIDCAKKKDSHDKHEINLWKSKKARMFKTEEPKLEKIEEKKEVVENEKTKTM